MKRAVLVSAALLAGAVPAAAQDREIITDISWPGIEAYCTFQREGQDFDYDDPQTWRFVFFTQLDTFPERPVETAFMAIGHQLRQLDAVGVEAADGREIRRYRSLGDQPHDIVVTMVAGEEDYEAGGYSGTISVSGPLGAEEASFHGDCGG